MAKRKTTPESTLTWDDRFISYLVTWRVEVGGAVLAFFAAITLFGLLNLTRADWLTGTGGWAYWWRLLLGWGAYLFWISVAGGGLYVALRRFQRPFFTITAWQVIGLELLLLTILPLSHEVIGGDRASAWRGEGGGLVGWALSEPLLDFLGPLLTNLFYVALLVWGLALLLRVGWDDVPRWLETAGARLARWAAEQERRSPRPAATVAAGAHATVTEGPAPATAGAPPQIQLRAPDPDELIIIDDSAPEGQGRLRRRDKRLPDIDMLPYGASAPLSKEEIDAKSQIIETTLADFGLPATVTEIRRGPAVTQFGVQPGYIERTGPDGESKLQKVRIGQIASLQKDLTLALAAPRLRIEAPVPGRGIVGVEVPNAEVNIVRLRGLIESPDFYKLNAPLGVGLGRDVSGSPLAIDLAKMPHLLIAGTTGSGKSICINALITCLVFNNTPEQLNLVMIDPKKVELIRFNGLPHLLGQVEVEPDRAIGVLRWLTNEMDRRYQSFAEVGAKHLVDYNRKIKKYKYEEPLPYICVFIDELADLILNYGGDVERTLCRLAQMARATGIHLIVATQRPSTDVITGLIKANFPARIAFAVASGTDSRVILDTVGAEQLLGRGDMLYLSPEAAAPARLQGCFVADEEIERVVNHWQTQMPTEPPEPPWEKLIARQTVLDGTDELLEKAIELAQKNEFISASLIQRRLRLGYPRAARLMEHLYEMGLVDDPKRGGRTRRTFVNDDDDPLDTFIANS